MSAESKQSIVNRLNAQNVIRRPVLGGPPRPGAFDPMQKAPEYDPKNPFLVIQQLPQQIPFRAFFSNVPTDKLYDIRNLIDEILGSRPDAKR
jgi:hypothetical protein